MSGNVAEWCSDSYDKDAYQKDGVPQGNEKVIRGGSWRDKSDYCRVHNRRSQDPTEATAWVGFRLVSSI